MAVSELPQGFVVDQPSSQAPASNTSASGTGNLPPGFVVDGDTTAQPPAKPGMIDMRADLGDVAGGAKDLIDKANTGVLKLATGKGFQDRAIDATTPVIPQATSRPFDANVTAASKPLAQAGNIAKMTAAGTAGSMADMATSPTALVAAGAKPIGMGLKAAGDAIGTKTGLFDLMKANQSLKNPEKMAQDVRASLLDPKTGQKAQWGKDFEQRLNDLIAKKPYDTVNLQSEVSSMRSAMDDAETNPGLASQIKSVIRTIKNPDAAKTMSEIIDDPSKAANLTLKQSQDLKVAIQNTPAIKMKLAQGRFANYTQGDLELLDLLHNVKLKQAENFPELADVRQPYADKMTAYNLVKNKFKPGQLEGNIKNGFGDSEIESKVKSILPDATNKQIANIRQVLALKKAGKWAAGIAGVGSADAVIRKVTGQ